MMAATEETTARAPRRNHTPVFKANAALAAVRASGRRLVAQPKTITSIGMREWVHIGQL